MAHSAVLALENGAVFYGDSIGASGEAVGEVIFNTAMTGYQEILTDPSYAQQMITFTYPHIGNVGINREDIESSTTWAVGVIMREYSKKPSNWRSHQTLQDFLKAKSIVGIAGIDTRRLTRIIRDQGAQKGCIIAGTIDVEHALRKAKEFKGLDGMDLARVVSTEKPYLWTESSILLPKPKKVTPRPFHVLVYDFGVKQQILRMLVDRGCKVSVVPAQTSTTEAAQYEPDGVFISNGPGDPAACDYAQDSIRFWLAQNKPLFGICLGLQLLALAAGAKTIKMKFGHHGANHPVLDMNENKVFISSQNHGFAVDEKTLPAELRITHRSLFDDSVQGLEYVNKPAFGFQGHPEASPGPHDLGTFFDQFVSLMEQNQSN